MFPSGVSLSASQVCESQLSNLESAGIKGQRQRGPNLWIPKRASLTFGFYRYCLQVLYDIELPYTSPHQKNGSPFDILMHDFLPVKLGAIIRTWGTCSTLQSVSVFSANVPCTYYAHRLVLFYQQKTDTQNSKDRRDSIYNHVLVCLVRALIQVRALKRPSAHTIANRPWYVHVPQEQTIDIHMLQLQLHVQRTTQLCTYLLYPPPLNFAAQIEQVNFNRRYFREGRKRSIRRQDAGLKNTKTVNDAAIVCVNNGTIHSNAVIYAAVINTALPLQVQTTAV